MAVLDGRPVGWVHVAISEYVESGALILYVVVPLLAILLGIVVPELWRRWIP